MKKVVIGIMILTMPWVAGCDTLYRILDKKGAEEKEIVGQVIPYEANPTVEEIQSLLKIYGYNPGEIDGQLGLRTRNAIERFQRDWGLTPTRYADRQTWDYLNRFQKNDLIKDRQLNIVLIQKILKEAGCRPGEIDGKRGSKTNEAIKRFQKKAGIKVDGKVGYQTLDKMEGFLMKLTPPEEIKRSAVSL
jgi:peptidoglycan hydrolase-like protein with peptidoglycan-binding domain